MPQGDIIVQAANIVVNHQKLVAKSNAVRFIKPQFFKVDGNKLAVEQGGIDVPFPNVLASGYDKTSWLGTPIYDAFRILPFSYTDQDGKIVKILEAAKEGEKGKGGTIDFDTVLMEVNQPKNIVTTKVAGKNGTVKEYISDGDYEISVTGMITSKYNNVSPQESDANYIAAIMAILKANVAIPVSSNFLTMFGIDSVVVMDYKLNQIEGTRNAIGITMNLLSDVPFEIAVKYQEDSVRNARKSIFSF